jgi:hypothetical protein
MLRLALVGNLLDHELRISENAERGDFHFPGSFETQNQGFILGDVISGFKLQFERQRDLLVGWRYEIYPCSRAFPRRSSIKNIFQTPVSSFNTGLASACSVYSTRHTPSSSSTTRIPHPMSSLSS